MQEKQLELSRREAFFQDPFFADMQGSMRDGLKNQLAEFSARSMGVAGAGLNEAAHNIQVSASNDKFQIQLELPGFAPEDFSLKTKDDIIIVEAVHEAKNEDGSTDSRKFSKEFKMPGGVASEKLASTYSGAGILTVSAPRAIQAPEGAQVSEAMKAQSQAFVTEDGTAVKKNEKASNQSIAATTQSPDGSTISSFKSSSSSSSSSTMMSGGNMPMMGGMPSMMGGMPPMGSMLGGGMQMPSLGMDDMMSKMMGNMNMGGMSSMPPPTPSQTPREDYTVTSPPMSPPPEMNHKVSGAADYTAPAPNQTAEATVLLKVKDGDEYKLALNMQQYSPDDITIKLNGNELVVEAAGHGEQFRQKHIVPDNINLDLMSSSFSSDGVLVIKAPKK